MCTIQTRNYDYISACSNTSKLSYLSGAQLAQDRVVSLQTLAERLLVGDVLFLLQSYAVSKLRNGVAKLLQVLGLRNHLHQLRSKVDHKLTVVR